MSDATGQSLTIGERPIARGTRQRVDLEFANLPGQARLSLPIEALVGSAERGEHKPARVWLSAAIHGDEINGLEIINRLLKILDPETMCGAVIAAPIVNVFGFAFQSRYMPDRRDLNRSFPGSKRGSLAARLARFFLDEVVSHCTHGIDLHTGSNHRTNLPQIRTDLNNPECARLAQAFAAPVMIHGDVPSGSLRAAVTKLSKPILVYEAGEALRFDEGAIELGVAGVLQVLAELGVIDKASATPLTPNAHASQGSLCGTGPNLEVRQRYWIRSPASGIFGRKVELGDCVEKGQLLGDIHEPLGDQSREVTAARSGVVIGYTNNPLSYQGDALIHLAHSEDPTNARDR